MKTQTLLAKAKRCRTEAEASKFLATFQGIFSKAPLLSHLLALNGEAYIESGNGAYASFQLARVLNEFYIISIQPKIGGGTLSIRVVTDVMLDGHGIASKQWKTLERINELVECDPCQSLPYLIRQAKELAIDHHRMLIESVGVPEEFSKAIARKSW